MTKEVRKITHYVCKRSKMAGVYVDDKCIMEGNFWDFHPGCHGIHEYGPFHGSGHLVEVVAFSLRGKGFTVTIEKPECHWYDDAQVFVRD